MTTTNTELLWRVVGYDTRKMMNQSLLYVADLKEQAYETCKRNHPDLDVYYVQRVDDEDTSWTNYPWNV